MNRHALIYHVNAHVVEHEVLPLPPRAYRALERGCDPQTHTKHAQEYHAKALENIERALKDAPESLSVLCDSLRLARQLEEPSLSALAEAGLKKVFVAEMTSSKDPPELLQSATIAFSLGFHTEAGHILARIIEVHPKESKEAIGALQDMTNALTQQGTLEPGLSELRPAISLLAQGKHREAFGLLGKLIGNDVEKGVDINPLHVLLARVAAYEAKVEIEYAELLNRLAANKKIDLKQEALQPVGLPLEDLQRVLDELNQSPEIRATRGKFHEYTRTHHVKPIDGTAASVIKNQ